MATYILIKGHRYLGGATIIPDSVYVTIPATYAEVKELFTKGVKWSVLRVYDDGEQTIDCSDYSLPGRITDEQDGSGLIGIRMTKPTDQQLLNVFTSGTEVTMDEAEALRSTIETSVQPLPDSAALASVCLYPTFDSMVGKTAENTGFKFQYKSELWKTAVPNTTFDEKLKPDTPPGDASLQGDFPYEKVTV